MESQRQQSQSKVLCAHAEWTQAAGNRDRQLGPALCSYLPRAADKGGVRRMRWVYAIRLRLRSLFRRAQVENELRAEFQYHLDRETERNEAGGMSPDQARLAAL